jgi:hypothetical protein
MNNENRFQDARAAMKDLAKKVETIDLSGSGLVGGKVKRVGAKKTAKKRSVSRKRSTSAKRVTKARSTSRKRSTSATKSKKKGTSSKKTPISLDEHKLADNLIQLGV